MKSTVLAARKQTAIETIAAQAERITGDPLDLSTGIRGDTAHRQLAMLERIAVFLADVEPVDTAVTQENESEDTAVRYTADEILAIPGLTKTSEKAIKEAFNVSAD